MRSRTSSTPPAAPLPAPAAPTLLEQALKLPPAQILAIHQAGTAELCRRRFREFIPRAWHVVEPSTPYFPNWHIDAIAEHLQAVTEYQIQNLIINMPPRTMKSLSVAVFWQAWEWTRDPSVQWLFTSYADDLSIRDAVKCRRLIASPWYQALWGNTFRLTGDQNEKSFYLNDKNGSRFTSTIGGQITGWGADRLILDDPLKVADASSELVLNSTLTFMDESWYNRWNNPKTVGRVIVMQRVAEKDPTSHALSRGSFVHLRLPMEYEARPFSYGKTSVPLADPLGFVDPRTREGELLWPARIDDAVIKEEKKGGDLYFATQFQQRPYARGGGMFNVDMLRARVVAHRPPGPKRIIRSWDLAATEKKTSKRTAGVRLSETPDRRIWVEHVVLGKWMPDKRNDIMLATTQADATADLLIGTRAKVLFEHEGGSSGEDQALAIVRLLRGHVVEGIKVTGDKVTRADPLAAQVNAGNVWVVDDGTWNVEAFFAELEAFGPTGEYKDQVDAADLGYNWLVKTGPALKGGVPELPADNWRLGPSPAPGADFPPEVKHLLPQDRGFVDPFGGAGNWRENFPGR